MNIEEYHALFALIDFVPGRPLPDGSALWESIHNHRYNSPAENFYVDGFPNLDPAKAITKEWDGTPIEPTIYYLNCRDAGDKVLRHDTTFRCLVDIFASQDYEPAQLYQRKRKLLALIS